MDPKLKPISTINFIAIITTFKIILFETKKMGDEIIIPKLVVQKTKYIPLKCTTFIASLCADRAEGISKVDPRTSIRQAYQRVRYMDTDVDGFLATLQRYFLKRS